MARTQHTLTWLTFLACLASFGCPQPPLSLNGSVDDENISTDIAADPDAAAAGNSDPALAIASSSSPTAVLALELAEDPQGGLVAYGPEGIPFTPTGASPPIALQTFELDAPGSPGSSGGGGVGSGVGGSDGSGGGSAAGDPSVPQEQPPLIEGPGAGYAARLIESRTSTAEWNGTTYGGDTVETATNISVSAGADGSVDIFMPHFCFTPPHNYHVTEVGQVLEYEGISSWLSTYYHKVSATVTRLEFSGSEAIVEMNLTYYAEMGNFRGVGTATHLTQVSFFQNTADYESNTRWLIDMRAVVNGHIEESVLLEELVKIEGQLRRVD